MKKFGKKSMILDGKTNKWRHCCISFDGTKTRIFINGKQKRVIKGAFTIDHWIKFGEKFKLVPKKKDIES